LFLMSCFLDVVSLVHGGKVTIGETLVGVPLDKFRTDVS